ncbi:MAG: flagellar biosynthesis protein FlhB [Spirochaetaceae bacterium]|jgi:flagellar biosynthetic protein FlhB|nr:flagellar biosynthesis protein FlhB [Spirochaetaceae bacterium]GMO22118.1 MAG: flagellar biosynthesis protein FlhB [Termitinemataceae bacterium]
MNDEYEARRALFLNSAAYIDLQWFAAEDEGRTEEPTERKIQKAREEGRVVKSRELIGAIGLLLPAVALLFLAPYLLRTFAEMLRFFLTRSAEIDPVRDRLLLGLVITYFVKLAMPVLAIALLAGLFSNIAQVGFLWTTKPLEFKAERIIPNFAQYFSKTLFSANGVFNLFLSITKMAIIGVTAFIVIHGDIYKIANLENANLFVSFTMISGLAIKLVIIVALLLLLLSIPDYMFQRWQFRESMRMTTQEVKEERKESEGDPQIKSRLRSRMRELLRQNIAQNVPKADVVITNPTHYAVALEYNTSLYGPRVLAKGEDELALRIKKIAADNDVPVVENKPLARALYAEVEIGEIVPEHYFTIIAEILTRVKGIDYWAQKMGRAT